jgi:hypothetical protein
MELIEFFATPDGQIPLTYLAGKWLACKWLPAKKSYPKPARSLMK